MKLTESKLRKIIKEELQKIDEKAPQMRGPQSVRGPSKISFSQDTFGSVGKYRKFLDLVGVKWNPKINAVGPTVTIYVKKMEAGR